MVEGERAPLRIEEQVTRLLLGQGELGVEDGDAGFQQVPLRVQGRALGEEERRRDDQEHAPGGRARGELP
ncbi:MAG: hypothetical protein AMXMBFR53_27890 [Gemmatimonadota bacterium]